MSKLMLDDRVIGIENVDKEYPTKGVKGTVIALSSEGDITVKFDEDVKGWSEEGKFGEYNCLYCKEEELQLLEDYYYDKAREEAEKIVREARVSPENAATEYEPYPDDCEADAEYPEIREGELVIVDGEMYFVVQSGLHYVQAIPFELEVISKLDVVKF